MKSLLITALVVVAASAMEPGCRPDSELAHSTPYEVLPEIIVRHAAPDPVLAATIAPLDKFHSALVREMLRDGLRQRLSPIIVQRPSSRAALVRDIYRLISVCGKRPRNVAVLRDLLTEETAPLFLLRLLQILFNKPGLIVALFGVIGHIRSVAELTPGWVSFVYNDFCLVPNKTIKRMCVQLLRRTPPAFVYGCIGDIPNDILDTVRQHAVLTLADSPIRTRLRTRLPDPFAWINPLSFCDVVEDISLEHADLIQSRPHLARNLFFLGTPVDLNNMTIAAFTADGLRALLPFALFVNVALANQIYDLIELGRDDLIAIVLQSEAFFSPSFPEYCNYINKIVAALIQAGGQHAPLLRLLLEAPLPDGWVAEVGSLAGGPILHRAVHARNVDAVRVLLAFPDLIDVRAVDEDDWDARSHAPTGSEIDRLLIDALNGPVVNTPFVSVD